VSKEQKQTNLNKVAGQQRGERREWLALLVAALIKLPKSPLTATLAEKLLLGETRVKSTIKVARKQPCGLPLPQEGEKE
jgi:hypothetical protein